MATWLYAYVNHSFHPVYILAPLDQRGSLIVIAGVAGEGSIEAKITEGGTGLIEFSAF